MIFRRVAMALGTVAIVWALLSQACPTDAITPQHFAAFFEANP